MILSRIVIQIQPTLISSLLITVCLCFFFVYAGKKIKSSDPLKKPKGLVLALEYIADIFINFFKTVIPERLQTRLIPYFSCIAVYIFFACVVGLIGLPNPASNLSITLALGLITFVFTQLTAFHKKGGFKYFKGMLLPPTNILVAISPLISLSVRLFGTVLSGTIILGLVYSATGWISLNLFSFIPVDIIAPFILPVLHAYFDLFAGLLQTFIFVTLSGVYISMEV
jgi:F0F1-type ATP synthase, subunit a